MDKHVAVVTGAAKGIGKAIASKLVKDGFYTVLVDLDNGEDVSSDLGSTASFVACDISNREQVASLFNHIKNIFGRVDVLVNNAGIIKDNVIWKMPEDDFDKVINVNLKGTWLMCKEASKMMKEQNFGRIINISSRAWLGNAGQSNYSASKAGIIGLTRVLALELGKYGVLVNAIAPGLIDTPLTNALPEKIKEKLIQAQPTRSMGQVEDIANTVSFLSNKNTKFITGQTIYVDGGKSIGAGM